MGGDKKKWKQANGLGECLGKRERAGKQPEDKERGNRHEGKETVSRFGLFLRIEGGELSIGDKCFMNTQVSITCMDRISIGDRCQIANHVVIVDHDHDYRAGWGHYQTAPVNIGKDVWIGANVVILKGSVIGDGAVIAAGTVVRGQVKPRHLYLGIHKPQRPLREKE